MLADAGVSVAFPWKPEFKELLEEVEVFSLAVSDSAGQKVTRVSLTVLLQVWTTLALVCLMFLLVWNSELVKKI